MPNVSAAKLAKALNVSERRVRQLVEAGIIQRESHGHYDLAKCLLAVARTKADRLPEPAAEIPGLTAERERRLRVQRERDEIRLAKERGELIPLETFRAEVSEAFRTVRDRLLSLPARMAPQLEGESRGVIFERLDAEIREMLTSLSGDHGNRPSQPDPAGSPPGPRPGGDLPGTGAAAEPEDLGVGGPQPLPPQG